MICETCGNRILPADEGYCVYCEPKNKKPTAIIEPCLHAIMAERRIKTYIIQIKTHGTWGNVTSSDATPLEFIFKDHAESVARIMAHGVFKNDGIEPLEENYQLVDSFGEKHKVVW